ncbi:MAG: BMP family ABC transporter substrate-binding protein [Clostridia bacterium]|nr:BMP family ABC transporter substrate-binding protein [Clostridia bacterium]
MSRTDAIEQYITALNAGRKYYRNCIARGQYPYPQVLDKLLENQETAGQVNLGLLEIPADRIVGTWVEGRKSAFAGNMMPLLDPNTEFGDKWINLCNAHLEEGIRDPISCIEYLGKFYIQEGHKRVSVLKSYACPTILGTVNRIIPAPSDDPQIRLYYEFMDFYKLSGSYLVSFTSPGGYAKLQAALGLEPDQVWSETLSRDFSSFYRAFTAVFDRVNVEKLPLTPGDALLSILGIQPYSEVQAMSAEQLKNALTLLWPDMRLLAQGEPISVSAAPEEKEKGLLGRILGTPRLHAAFIYTFDPEKSPWASAHRQGQQYLADKLGDSVTVSDYLCGDDPLETMEQAIAQGANVIFATAPSLVGVCRRIAARHKNVVVFNCSLSVPYAGVRGYYARIYEGKFISGAIAGAMAANDSIGYVANYPILGVPAAVNAFALGARLTNPRATVHLRWSCLPGNPFKDLLDEGVSVISNRDEDGAKPFLSWHLGTFQVAGSGLLTPLASPCWNWGKFYEKTMRSLQVGGIDALRDSRRAVNDWWGLSTGVVDVSVPDSLPAGMKQLVRILKNGVIDGAIDPFLCPLTAQDGTSISDGSRLFTPEEIMHMDWLCDNVEGSIPAFDSLLPQSQDLVRLLGVYREAIPPKTEEAAL